MSICFLFYLNFFILIIFGEYFLIKTLIDIYYFFYSLLIIKNIDTYIIKKEKYMFRIEKNGKGPFRNKEKDKKWKKMLDKLNKKNIVSHPLIDKKLKKSYIFLIYLNEKELKQYLYGFSNIKTFFKWFDKEDLKLLKKKNYKLNLYKVFNYIEGTNQIMFKKKYAKFIKEIKY